MTPEQEDALVATIASASLHLSMTLVVAVAIAYLLTN